jgi:hypothetical protein
MAAPLVTVLQASSGGTPERPHTDVDLLACGHALTGARDRIAGDPARRRCYKCAHGRRPHIDAQTMAEARAD